MKTVRVFIKISLFSFCLMSTTVFGQNFQVAWSAIDMGFEVSSSANTTITSVAGQGFVTASRDQNTIIESGFLADTRFRGGVLDVKEPEESFDELPATFSLEQNYPNPFNPSTVFSFRLPVSGYVTLKVYNVLGEEVATLIDGVAIAGHKTIEWNANNLSSGMYMYRFQAEKFSETKKLLLMK